VAIVTGAGQGLGRSHALLLAAQGASVVVNDLGTGVHGGRLAQSPAQQLVDEIIAQGGRAVASTHDVSNWDDAGKMIQVALHAFGDLHVLVNNAGIIRDRTLANMTESEWDDVIRVHLKAMPAPLITQWHIGAAVLNQERRLALQLYTRPRQPGWQATSARQTIPLQNWR